MAFERLTSCIKWYQNYLGLTARSRDMGLEMFRDHRGMSVRIVKFFPL